jgi:hypothetical protein
VLKLGFLAASSVLVVGAASLKTPLLQVLNNTKSIAVERVDEDDRGYHLTLRNALPVAVFGLAVAVIGENGVCDLHTFRPISGSFIDSNGNRELPTLSFPSSEAGGWGPRMGVCSDAAVRDPQSHTPDSPIAPRIVIETVDFENGTYEGDQAEGVMFEAERVGRGLQRQRIAALVEKEIESEGMENADWVGIVRARVSALTEQVEPEMLHSLQIRLGPAVDTEESIRQDIRNGLIFEKSLFLNQLKLYVAVSLTKGVPIVSLQTWWQSTKGRCDFFLPQCRNETM